MNIKILSRNSKLYSTRRLLEAAEKRKHNVQVIDPLKCDLVIEKRNPNVYYKGQYIEDTDAIIPRIGASVTFYGTAVVRQFEMMGAFSTIDSEALVRSRDKLRSMQVLTRARIGLPKTVFTNYSRDVEGVIQQVGGTPLVIKLLEGTQGLGVVLAETRTAAKSVIEAFNGLQARVIAFKSLNANILVQEFIKEAKGADIRVFVIDGHVVGAMKRQSKEGEFRSNLHQGGSAEVIELTDEEEIAAIKAAKAMRLGVAGVDMLQSDRGPLILEVNSSPGLEGIEKATGKDIARKIIQYIEKNV